MHPNKKVAFYTLGCKLNFSETSSIAKSFNEQGFATVDFSDHADCYVINTCSVTDNADKKLPKHCAQSIAQQSNRICNCSGLLCSIEA